MIYIQVIHAKPRDNSNQKLGEHSHALGAWWNCVQNLIVHLHGRMCIELCSCYIQSGLTTFCFFDSVACNIWPKNQQTKLSFPHWWYVFSLQADRMFASWLRMQANANVVRTFLWKETPHWTLCEKAPPRRKLNMWNVRVGRNLVHVDTCAATICNAHTLNAL